MHFACQLKSLFIYPALALGIQKYHCNVQKYSSSQSNQRACKNNCAILATTSYFLSFSRVLCAVLLLSKCLVTP